MSERITYEDLTGSNSEQAVVEASPRVTYEDLIQEEQKENTNQQLSQAGYDAIKESSAGVVGASVVDKVSRLTSGISGLIGSLVDEAPRALMHSGYTMLHNLFAEEGEEIDTAEESQALMHAITGISRTFSPANAALADATDRIEEALDPYIDKHEGKDFVDLAETGDWLEAGDAFLGDVASALPSVGAAFLGPGGLAAIGGSAFGSKYQQEFDENPEQSASNLFMAAAGTAGGEVLTEAFTAGLGGGITKLATKLGPKAAKAILKNAGTKIAFGFTGEGFSEGAADTWERVMDYAILGDKEAFKEGWRGFAKNFLLGGFIGSGITIAELTNPGAKAAVIDKVRPHSISEANKEAAAKVNALYVDYQNAVTKGDDTAADAILDQIEVLNRKMDTASDKVEEQAEQLTAEQLSELNDIKDERNDLQDYLNERKGDEAGRKAVEDKIEKLDKESERIFSTTLSQEVQQGGVGAKSKQLIKEANTAYEAGDFDAVVKTQEAVAHQVARSMWNKVPKELQVGTYDDFIQSLLWDKKDSVKKLVNEFSPDKGKNVSGYVNKFLRNRANRQIKNFTKQKFETTIPEGTDTGVGGTTTFDPDTIKVTIGSAKSRSAQLGVDPSIVTDAKKAAEQAFLPSFIEGGFRGKGRKKGKPIKTAKDYDANLREFLRERLGPKVKEAFGKKEDFKNYLEKNWNKLYNSVDASAWKGQISHWKESNPGKEEFMDWYLDPTQNDSTRSDRKTALANFVAETIGREIRDEYLDGEHGPEAKKYFVEQTGIKMHRITSSIYRDVNGEPFVDGQLQKDFDVSKDDYIANISGGDTTYGKFTNVVEKAVEAGYVKPENAKIYKNHDEAFAKGRESFMEIWPDYFPPDFFTASNLSNVVENNGKVTGNGTFLKAQEHKALAAKSKVNVGTRWDKPRGGNVSRTNIDKILNKNTHRKTKMKELETLLTKPEVLEANEAKIRAFQDVWEGIERLLKDHPDQLPNVHRYLTQETAARGILSEAAVIRGVEVGLDGKAPADWRSEHTMPLAVANGYMLELALDPNRSVKDGFKNVENKFFQIWLSKKSDDKLKGFISQKQINEFHAQDPSFPKDHPLKFTFQSAMPPGWTFKDSTWARYLNPLVNYNNGGINPKEIYKVVDGKLKSIAEIYAGGSMPALTTVQVSQTVTQDPVTAEPVIEIKPEAIESNNVEDNIDYEALNPYARKLYNSIVRSKGKIAQAAKKVERLQAKKQTRTMQMQIAAVKAKAWKEGQQVDRWRMNLELAKDIKAHKKPLAPKSEDWKGLPDWWQNDIKKKAEDIDVNDFDDLNDAAEYLADQVVHEAWEELRDVHPRVEKAFDKVEKEYYNDFLEYQKENPELGLESFSEFVPYDDGVYEAVQYAEFDAANEVFTNVAKELLGPQTGDVKAHKLPSGKEVAPKKLRVFDFDDTLAHSNSKTHYTLPNGESGSLTAAEFAVRHGELVDAGASFDYSEFDQVIDGKKGPLADVAKAIQDARGDESIHILTARTQQSADAIKGFLETIGLNVPLDNITGLADGRPEAKAQWFVDKIAEGYNDFYFADDAKANVDAVSDVIKDFGGRSQLALTPDQVKAASQQAVMQNSSDQTIPAIDGSIQKHVNDAKPPRFSQRDAVEGIADLMGNAWRRWGNGKIVSTDAAKTREDLLNSGWDAAEADNLIDNTYGFNSGNYIFVNAKLTTPETAVHEFNHAWQSQMREQNPEIYNTLLDIIQKNFRDSPILNEAVAETMELYGHDPYSIEFWDEVIAQAVGKRGNEVYTDLYNSSKDDANRFMDAFKKYWDWVGEFLGIVPRGTSIHDLNVGQILDMITRDTIQGNPGITFKKLKDVTTRGKVAAKAEARVKAKLRAANSPQVMGMQKVKEVYRETKNLQEAIEAGAKEAKMDHLEFAELVQASVKEVQLPNTTALSVAKGVHIDTIFKAQEAARKANEANVKQEEDVATFNNILKEKGKTKATKWAIPPNTEDFQGLLYSLLPDGAAGREAQNFLNEKLLKPYETALNNLTAEQTGLAKAWKAIASGARLNKTLDGTKYSRGEAIQIAQAQAQGKDSVKDAAEILNYVKADPQLSQILDYVDQNYPQDPDAAFDTRNLAQQVYDGINQGARDRHLKNWKQNVDTFFTPDTWDALKRSHGPEYVAAMKDMIRRMKAGSNRGANGNPNPFYKWMGNAVAATMFINRRSAILQLLSTVNYIGVGPNTAAKALKAFANFGQFSKDVAKLWNSPFLKDRRQGAKFDVLTDALQEDTSEGWVARQFAKIRRFGFLPTQMADSFAIAVGGASFYRNRIDQLVKEGKSKSEAAEIATNEWISQANRSQQSSDPYRVSQIQAEDTGKIFFAFANTPFQYMRIAKRAVQDVASGRSKNPAKDMATAAYYTAGQTAIFASLQTGLAALAMSSDDEEQIDEKTRTSIDRGITGLVKSLGYRGAAAATIYSILSEVQKGSSTEWVAQQLLSASPPLSAKYSDLKAAIKAWKKDNWGAAASEGITFATGVGVDRLHKGMDTLNSLLHNDYEAWQRIWRILGWSDRDLGFEAPKEGERRTRRSRRKRPTRKRERRSPLDAGEVGQAFNDGTIEIDPNLKGEERERTIAHETYHANEIKEGRLNYNKDSVFYRGRKFPRKNGKIKQGGKWKKEGDRSFPWEQEAYAAEESAMKRHSPFNREGETTPNQPLPEQPIPWENQVAIEERPVMEAAGPEEVKLIEGSENIGFKGGVKIDNLSDGVHNALLGLNGIGFDVVITSGERSAAQNAAVGGSSGSAHKTNAAADLRTPRNQDGTINWEQYDQMLEALVANGAQGIGIYGDNAPHTSHIHFDDGSRRQKKRKGPDGRGIWFEGDVPKWIRNKWTNWRKSKFDG